MVRTLWGTAALLLVAGMGACPKIRSTGSATSEGGLLVEQVRSGVAPPGDYSVCFALFAASAVAAFVALALAARLREVVGSRYLQPA